MNTTASLMRSGVFERTITLLNFRGDFENAREAADMGGDKSWTHICEVGTTEDVRDAYQGQTNYVTIDSVFIPDDTAADRVEFIVRMSVLTIRGKTLYLDRAVPNWPTSNL